MMCDEEKGKKWKNGKNRTEIEKYSVSLPFSPLSPFSFSHSFLRIGFRFFA